MLLDLIVFCNPDGSSVKTSSTHCLPPSRNFGHSVHDHVSVITYCLDKDLESCPKPKVLYNSHLSLENIKYANRANTKNRNISFASSMPAWSFYLLLTEGYLGLLQLQYCHQDLCSYWIYKKWGIFSHRVIKEIWRQITGWMLYVKYVKKLHVPFSRN